MAISGATVKPSWNPLRCSGTVLPTNLLLMAKLIALCLLLTNHVRQIPDPWLPFVPAFDWIGAPAAFQRGLQRANSYLARRTDILGLIWDGAPAAGPGGTGELALWRRESLRIPVDLDFAERPAAGDGRLVVIPVRRS